MSRSLFNYESSKKEDPKIIREIIALKEKHPYYGVPRILACLRRQGHIVNGKRVYRIVKTLKFGIERKRRWNRPFLPIRDKIPQAKYVGDVWAMDFVADKFSDGESFRCLTIIDTLSREVPGMLVRKSMSLHAPLKFLEEFKMKRKLPNHIVVDNGSEFANKAFVSWCEGNKVKLHFIDPGKPVQNAYIESFNGKFREEFLSRNNFENVHHVNYHLKKWIDFYNNERPHKSLDYLTPKEFADLN
jgi:putative transposase